MKKKRGQPIAAVLPGSIAEELEICPGDVLLSINDHPIEDIFDYRYLCSDDYLQLHLRDADGEEYWAELEKEPQEDLGLVFGEGLMDEAKSCQNKCIFCFIDQMPPGMRETLYFKDDDSRLSFLQGNYVTLTNMKERDIERICRYHLSPINVSVHTTNLELRKKMLHNRFADKVLTYMEQLAAAHITMNLQIVLCKGINDGAVLDQSIADLARFLPHAQSLSVVPVGLTRFREGLYPLKPFLKEDAAQTLDLIEGWQKKLAREHGTRFVFAADEFYLKAERPLPPPEAYEEFYQLENGVGMLSLFRQEFYEALAQQETAPARKITLVSGQAAYPLLCELCRAAEAKFPRLALDVRAIRNDFFGPQITVSGLLTGQDIVAQLKDTPLGDVVLLPGNLLRSGEETLLDDMTLSDLHTALGRPVVATTGSGGSLLDCILEGGRTE